MNRTLSRTILGLLVVAASAIVTGGAAQPPGTSWSIAAQAQAVDLPTQCLSEENFGKCVTCCKEAVQGAFPGNVCAHFCRNVVPPIYPPPPGP